MVKLIASDLDGTLLPPTKQMPAETFDLIKTLSEKGVLFTPASGRQLHNLQRLFEPVLDYIAIIAENGGLVWYKGEILFCDETPAKDVKFALDVIRKESNLFPILSCANCAFYESTNEKFVETLKRSYTSEKWVKNLDDIIGKETVLKISVWDPLFSAEHGGKILPDKLKGLRTIVSGLDWLDVCVLDANKGKALNALAKHFNIKREETVAFGDHLNDLEMLQASGKPYVTANAFPLLKQTIGEEIPSNAEFGVITKIKEIIKELN